MSSNLTLIGRVVNDLEIKKSKKGKEYALLRLAARRDYKNSKSEYITDFFMIPLWGKKALNAKKHTEKGSLVAVYGQLETNKTTLDTLDQNYINIVANRVEFLSRPKNNGNTKFNNKNIVKEETTPSNVTNEIQNFDIPEEREPNEWF